MLQKLSNKGILQADLQPENILWDAEKGEFNPVDITNIIDMYDEDDDLIEIMLEDADATFEMIKLNIARSS